MLDSQEGARQSQDRWYTGSQAKTDTHYADSTTMVYLANPTKYE